MTARTLKDGTVVPELANAITLQVYTRCPEKYMLVDLETGEQYRGIASEGKHSWQKINNKEETK